MDRVEKQHLRCPEARGQQESEALPERGQTDPKDPMAVHKSEGRGSSGFDRLQVPATARPLRCLARPSYRLVPCCRRRTRLSSSETNACRPNRRVHGDEQVDILGSSDKLSSGHLLSPLMRAHTRRLHTSSYLLASHPVAATSRKPSLA
ncbi:uncharacterized protein TrAtP1_000351 [Trichoderma atroviride]|uniref:uncharacterized protein n=1 Tax=Hypocrea atroviridis TaxID=63577 RepID=UPI00331C12E8|nr:hypothetical protein TrAtP1_000351 [Trichoderma atroviride]